MITIDSDPQLNPVRIGAKILNLLAGSDLTEIETEMLYNEIKQEFNSSYDIFVYSLDWLYVIGAIGMTEQGAIHRAIK